MEFRLRELSLVKKKTGKMNSQWNIFFLYFDYLKEFFRYLKHRKGMKHPIGIIAGTGVQ